MDAILNKIEKTKEAMSAMDAIYFRRAIRNYTKNRLDRNTVNQLLDAAIQAPSAMNAQPWAFVVVQKPEVLREISERSKEFLLKSEQWKNRSEHFDAMFSDPNFDIFYGASTLIVICAKANGISSAEDCYLAGENLMLAATSMGLGTCPIGFACDVLKSNDFRAKLMIPEQYVPVLPIVAGYPSAIMKKPERVKPTILSWSL